MNGWLCGAQRDGQGNGWVGGWMIERVDENRGCVSVDEQTKGGWLAA